MWFMLRKDWQGNWKRSIRAPKTNPKNPLEQGEVLAVLDLAPGQAVEVTDPYEIEFLSKDLKTDTKDGPLIECKPRSSEPATPVDLKLPKPAAAEEAAPSGGGHEVAPGPGVEVQPGQDAERQSPETGGEPSDAGSQTEKAGSQKGHGRKR